MKKEMLDYFSKMESFTKKQRGSRNFPAMQHAVAYAKSP